VDLSKLNSRKKSLFMKKHYLIMLLLCFISITAPMQVYADTDDDESVVIAEEDIFFQSIQGLVGSAANIIVGDDIPDKPDHLMAVLMETYGFGLISFAMIFMVFRGVKWFIQMGQEKNDNSMLDFNSAPLPIAMCVLAMLPMNDGYSPMQHIVIKVGGESISLANKETFAAADYLEKYGSFTVNPAILNTSMITNGILESAVCMSLINFTTGKTNVEVNMYEDIDLENNKHSFTVSYDGIYSYSDASSLYKADVAAGAKNGLTRAFPRQVCGTNTITFGAIDEKYVEQAAVMEFRRGVIDAYSQMNKAVSIAGAGLVDNLLISYVTELNSFPPSVKGQIKAAKNNFVNSYRNQLATLITRINESAKNDDSELANNNATQSLRKYGAGYLGVYFWEYARRNSIVTSITGLTSSNSQPRHSDYFDKIPTQPYEKVSRITKELLNEMRTDYSSKGPQSYVYRAEELDQAVIKTINESTSSTSIGFGSTLFSIISSGIIDQPDPILALQDFGHTLIITSESILTAAAIGYSLASMGAAGSDAAGDAAAAAPFGAGSPLVIPLRMASWAFENGAEIASDIMALAIVTLIFGILIAFWIPSIPLIHWINGSVGFLIVLMQAFILTPLLGLAHLLSSEKGFLNNQTQHGYMAIIQLFSYLPIMVISFFIAYLTLMAGAKFIQIVFIPFFEALNGNNITGIITGFIMLALFFIINVLVANRCFSLITTIPEKAGKFIGGGEEMLGDSSSINEGKGNFVAVTNSGKSGLQSGIANAAENLNKKKEKAGKEQGQGQSNENNPDRTGNDTSQGKNINSKTK